jgi:uncharacterized DUF497 family protein
MRFEWDLGKAAFNEAVYGVSFEEAKEVFNDPKALAYPDDLQSFDRERFVIIGFQFGDYCWFITLNLAKTLFASFPRPDKQSEKQAT